MGHFHSDRHALYAGWIIGNAMRHGISVRPITDNDGNYLPRLHVIPLGCDLIIPEPPPEWHFE
jgi:hypothetical protein